jgi:hypothetical protein
MGAPVFREEDVANFIIVYKIISSGTGTNLAPRDTITSFLNYCLETFPETVIMLHEYLMKD